MRRRTLLRGAAGEALLFGREAFFAWQTAGPPAPFGTGKDLKKGRQKSKEGQAKI